MATEEKKFLDLEGLEYYHRKNNKELPNFFFGVFFTSSGAKTNWYVSQNAVEWTKINIPQDFSSAGGRDPSIAYCKNNQTFYITHTTTSSNDSITIYTSKDLLSWEQHVCPVTGMSGERTWAPDLFIDDDDTMYIVVSNQYGTEADITGASIPAFDEYLIRCDDLDSLTLGEAQKITLSGADNRNHIDGSLSKIGEKYYLIVKDEYSKINEIYESTNLSSWTRVNDNITGSSLPLEGSQLVLADGNVYLIADMFTNGNYLSTKTPVSDFPNFNNAFSTINTLVSQRHGSMIYVSDSHAKRLISNIDGFSFSASSKTGKPTMNHQYITFGDSGSGHYLMLRPICAIPNSYVNFAGGSTSGVYDVQVANPFKLNEFKFCFGATAGATLRITHIDGAELASPIVVKNNNIINGKMMSVSITDAYRYDTLMFGTQTISVSDLTNIDSRISVLYMNCTKVGNVVTMNFKIKALEAVNAWVNALFTMPAGFRSVQTVLVSNDKSRNLQLTSSLAGNINAAQDEEIFCSATYVVA